MKEEYKKSAQKSNKKCKKHLSLGERIKIEVLLATRQTVRSIAKALNRSVSSISVEIKKGKYNGKYTALIADKRAVARAQNSHKHCKWRDCQLLVFYAKMFFSAEKTAVFLVFTNYIGLAMILSNSSRCLHTFSSFICSTKKISSE